MMQNKHQQTLLAASLFSWLILFALPFASSPLNNGTQWVHLCTQSGLKLVAIESTSSQAPASFHSLDCPCLSHAIHTAEYQALLPAFETLDFAPITLTNEWLPSNYLRPPLRAPPTV